MVALGPEIPAPYNLLYQLVRNATRAHDKLIIKFGRCHPMNLSRHALLPCILAVLVAALLPSPASAAIKCWTNGEGVRECGNSVPPEFAQGSHREVTSMGVTVSKTKRAKTQEELRMAREEAVRTAAIRADEARRIRERQTKDRVLLSTFTTEKELAVAHEGQVAAIDIRIGHTQKILKQLERSLAQLRSLAAKLERRGQPITPDIKDKIAKAEQQLMDRNNFIENRRLQKAALAAQFSEDLDRYRELKGISRKVN
jgi:hypothetical protein